MNQLITISFATGWGFTSALFQWKANTPPSPFHHTKKSSPLKTVPGKRVGWGRNKIGVYNNCSMKWRWVESKWEVESHRHTLRGGVGRWWHVDLWAAGLFINHTEIYWNSERGREIETGTGSQTWGGWRGGNDGSGVARGSGTIGGEIKFKQVMPLIALIVFHWFRCRWCPVSVHLLQCLTPEPTCAPPPQAPGFYFKLPCSGFRIRTISVHSFLDLKTCQQQSVEMSHPAKFKHWLFIFMSQL